MWVIAKLLRAGVSRATTNRAQVLRYFVVLVPVGISLSADPLPYELIGKNALTGREDAMVIALPGAAETAEIYVNIFSGGRYKKLARQRGYILVCVSGMAFKSRHEDREHQIIRLRDQLLVRYPRIRKVFLTGYSLGGRGALLIGLRHPEKFDGVAAVVPWLRLPRDKSRILPEMTRRIASYPHRVFVAYARIDFFFPFPRKDWNRFAAAGEGHIERRRYLTDHWLVVATSAGDMFDFFDKQRNAVGLDR